MLPEPIAVTLTVIEALESLGVSYMIGGSLASTVHGMVRATMDTDLVVNLHSEHAELLVQALGDAFYADIEAIRDAIYRRSSFNIIHMETMFKVDIFALKGRPFDQVQFERRTKHIVAIDPERTAYVTTAEDIALVKLEWYRMGGEVSERQWRDVLGVLKVQGDRLDLAYLRRWAVRLEITDLLARALTETRPS